MSDWAWANGRILRLRPHAVDWLEVEGEIVVLDARDSVYMSVNRTGAELWRQLASGTTRAKLAQSLADGYGITLDRAETDVDKFLTMLEERGLIQHIDSRS